MIYYKYLGLEDKMKTFYIVVFTLLLALSSSISVHAQGTYTCRWISPDEIDKLTGNRPESGICGPVPKEGSNGKPIPNPTVNCNEGYHVDPNVCYEKAKTEAECKNAGTYTCIADEETKKCIDKCYADNKTTEDVSKCLKEKCGFIVEGSDPVLEGIDYGPLPGGSLTDIEKKGLPGFKFAGKSLGDIVAATFPWIFGLSGTGLLLYLLYGGFHLMTSGGDPKAIQEAKGKITNSLIGFIIIFLAYWIVQILGQVLGLESIVNIFK